MFALISLILFLNIGIRPDYMTMLLFDLTVNAFYKVIMIVLRFDEINVSISSHHNAFIIPTSMAQLISLIT